eukprot:7763-Heterococcus_DN1.PRE.1
MKANIKSTSRLINNSFGKSANAAAKSLLGTGCVFTDLRAIYAAYSYLLYSASETSLQEWVRNVMQGGAHMLMTPAFLAKCQAVLLQRCGTPHLCKWSVTMLEGLDKARAPVTMLKHFERFDL